MASSESVVISIVAAAAAVGEDEITPSTDLLEDLDLDSVDLVEIASLIDVKLGVPIEDYLINDAKTVGDIIHAVSEQLK